MTMTMKAQPLTDLVTRYGRLFPEVLRDAVQPVYNFDLSEVFDPTELSYLQSLGSSMPLQIYTDEGIKEWTGPLPGQQHVIAGILKTMEEGRRRFIIRGETGVGKTQIQLMLLDMAARRGLDVYPALIIEPRRVTKQWRDRVKAILPNALTMKIERPLDVEVFSGLARLYHGKKPIFGMIPFSMISRGPGFRAVGRWVGYDYKRKDADDHYVPISPFIAGKGNVTIGCPTCFMPMNNIVIPQTRNRRDSIHDMASLERMIDRGVKVKCPRCGGALYEEVKPVPPGKDASDRNVRFDVGEYIFRNFKRLSRQAGTPLFQSLIIDELHQTMNQASIRGETAANMASIAHYLFGLGATIYGGTASSIFWIYFMFHPGAWYEWGPKPQAQAKWFDELANTAEITKIDANPTTTGQRAGKLRVTESVSKKELPAAPPRLIKMLAENTIHVKLQNLGVQLPPYEIQSIKVHLDPEHQVEYDNFFMQAMTKAQQHNIGAFASNYLQSAITYPIAPWQENNAMSSWANTVKIFPLSYICAPERALIEFVKTELAQQRKTIIYVTHTDIRDVVPRLISILADESITAVRQPKSMDRELMPEWLRDEASKYDTVILNQRAIEGVDAIKFQNTFFYEVDFSVYPVTQAAGRHWRLGQTKPCKTVFMEIEGTILHRALAIIMQRMAAASMVYGDDIDAQIGKYSANTVLIEAAKQEMAGSALPNLDKLFKRASEVITKGISNDDNGKDPEPPEEVPGVIYL